ncbi:hypothetical protein ACIA8G_09490 [Lentzea sp. NPDC051213]|uniref:nSTAND1 domain-containing NTPase n=1 Tax=Lentzea sp. NPDC051213 TaxID=3364126 RepID=UPI0037A3721A
MGRPERKIDPDAGPVQRFAWDLRQLREKAGSPSYRELSSRAHFGSTALSEAAGGSQFPSLEVTLGYVRACEGDVDAWTGYWREIAEELEAPGWDEHIAPYLGLAAFQAEDAARFHGREAVVAGLVAKLADTRFLGVFGPSGCGKSSLLRAGLVPALGIRSVVLTPTAHPVAELRARTSDQELIVVDQFEEIFTLCRDEAERDEFVSALLARRARVVVAGRVDFLGRCAAMPALVDALRDAQLLVGPMNADELRRAIEVPAATAGLALEPEMVTAALTDAHGRPGALPLLSHALLETWRRRENATLTLNGYREAGGVSGAIAATAEDVYTRLDEQSRDAVRGVLLRLVSSEDDRVGVRSRAALEEILGAGDRDATAAALDALTTARLVVVTEGGAELAHEAMIEAWPRLRGWTDENRERLRRHRDLTAAAHAWVCVGRDPGALYRGVRLATARAIAETPDWPALSTELEREFLEASSAQENSELATSARHTRRLRTLVRTLAVLLVVCAVVAVAAVVQRRAAVAEQHVAQSRQLALQAQDLSESWPDAARTLAVSAYRTAPTAEALGALLSTAAYKPARTVFKDHRGAVRAVALSGNGKLASAGDDRSVLVRDPGSAPVALTGHQASVHALAFHPSAPVVVSGSDDGQIIVWDLRNRTPVQQISLPHSRITGLEFSADGRWLASVSQDGTALLWEKPDAQWRESARIPHDLGALNGVTLSGNGDLVALAGKHGALVYDRNAKTGRTHRDHDGAVRTIALSPDGTVIATGGEDSQVVLRAGDAAPEFLRRHTASLRSVRFTPDGGKLMSASDDGSIRWWSVPDGGWLTGLIGRTGAFFAAALSPDGTRIAAGGDDSVSLWPEALPPFTGHAVPPFAVATTADGTVATGGADRAIMVWGADGARRHVLTAPATVKSLLFHPDGTLLSAGEDGPVTVWDIAARTPVRTFAGHQGPVTGLSLNPKGDLAASGGADRTIRLFDPRTPAPARVLPAAHTAEVDALQFSPDGNLLASGGEDGRLVLWDVEHDRRLAVLSERNTALRDIAFTPDGATLITGDASGTITLWDVAERREIGTLPGQRGAVREIAVSENLLAVAGSDTTITLWDTATRTQIASLTGHAGPANALAFGGQDGRTLASTGADPRVILWDLTPDAVAGRICEQGERCRG